MAVRRVAIIGAGAAGTAALTALVAEDYFDYIRVFERREQAGGTWIYDPNPGVLPFQPGALPPELDPPLTIPKELPSTTPPSSQHRFDRTPIYEELTTNVPDIAMAFSDLPFPYGPFVGHKIPRSYVENYLSWHQIDSRVSYNTTVEKISQLPHDKWNLVLRRHDVIRNLDEWWEEEFDAVVIANGHYSVPYVPAVSGLSEYIKKCSDRIEHSKTYRSPRVYADKSVVVVGNSASGYDIQQQLLKSGTTKGPVYVSRRSRGRWDGAEPPPGVVWKPVISEYRLDGSILFADGSILRNIDKVVYCTGYKPSYPFWSGRPLFDYSTNRLVNNYQHTFLQDLPTIALVGFPRVLTFRSFEYQAIAIARYWSGRNAIPMPTVEVQKDWEEKRTALTRKERRLFHQIEWDEGETMHWFSWLYHFAGLPQLEDRGRYPPVLGERTRWAIENVRKYPEPKREDGGNDKGERDSQKDSLCFI